MIVAGVWLLPKIEEFTDTLVDNYNHKNFLENINKKFKLENIYEIAEDAASELFCSNIPWYKQKDYPSCMNPPIILDLDSNGVGFIPLSEPKVYFDVNNGGTNDKVSWPTSGNAVLFSDWNGSGTVDS